MKRHLRRFLTTCQSENLLQTVDGPIHIDKIESGLGARFGYPSDMSHAKYEQKLNVWISYFEENSRNLTMVRQPIFSKMIRSGIPDELRGEVWEMSSGSMYLRFDQQGLYQQILKEHENDTSFAIEEIEKDLHRSLPEYPAYQTKEGIDRLRRVLIAYSWKNPEIGYCQSMNIVTSCLLIYMTEEQAFWILHALVDYLCPGYYSSSMYGALLDQVVLESLVKIHIPKLSTYLDERNLQLSVICLPWFLTLFFNSMPIAFAFRILDCFFLEGPRILFQIALAILKRHEKQLLTVDDESGLLMIMKEFFASLITPADDIFNSLMKSAYADFRRVTSTKIAALRKESELKIIGSVENFTKRNALRSIKSTANFGSDEISLIYDYFFGALYYANKQHDKDSTPEMDLVAFTKMLESMTTWAKLSSRDDYQDSIQHSEDFVLLDEVLKSFIRRLFNYFKSDDLTGITLTDCVSKLDELLRGDILSKASFYFALYDEDKDGKLMNTDLHSITAEMFLLMNLLNVDFNKWETICSFLALTVEESSTKEAADRLLNKIQDSEQLPVPGLGKINATYFVAHINKIHNALFELDIPSIKLTLPSFRAVLLTEDRLVQLIQTDIPRSFRLQKGTDEAQKGLGLEILETLILEGKKLAVTTNLARSNQQLLLPPPPSARRRLSSASIPPPIPTRSPRSPISTSTMSTHNNNNETHLEDDDYELL
ncbi:rab-GTPase-TBC domain-containing protein [Mycotypha africana]|uniref:rab-GTPase-TBC domain-containing protein n=1 Tax=Mycotypha africana TaxID=64632 RepID=UPI002301E38C|nr:rab-GTPase-TBC domain-containing protein [Mycotypha africana]KAI8990935.1 rab-GTPase-TBC domain-containing protein [Mycotypha africana]